MPKSMWPWFVDAVKKDSSGKIMWGADSKVIKEKIPMINRTFQGQPQSLYYEDGPQSGLFKGMEVILREHGYNTTGLLAQCKKFQCHTPALDCCLWQILYNEPDFQNVSSILETTCEACGFGVMLLPKFHCELNPIEQVWGYAKYFYWLCSLSSREDALEKNTLESLNAVPLLSIWQ